MQVATQRTMTSPLCRSVFTWMYQYRMKCFNTYCCDNQFISRYSSVKFCLEFSLRVTQTGHNIQLKICCCISSAHVVQYVWFRFLRQMQLNVVPAACNRRKVHSGCQHQRLCILLFANHLWKCATTYDVRHPRCVSYNGKELRVEIRAVKHNSINLYY